MKLDIPEGSQLVIPVALYSDGSWVRIINYTDDRPRTEFYALLENGKFIAGFTEEHEATEVYTEVDAPKRLLAICWLLNPI